MKLHRHTWDIYTDGGSRKKTGKRLFKGEKCSSSNMNTASGVVWIKDGEMVRNKGFLNRNLWTNNQAELEAIRLALVPLMQNRSKDTVRIYTDSEYCINVLTNGRKLQVNAAQVSELRVLLTLFTDLEFVKVKGHSGLEYNEMADCLATAALKLA